MKIVGTIVNNKLQLAGLVIEGKASEFGGMGDEKVREARTIDFIKTLRGRGGKPFAFKSSARKIQLQINPANGEFILDTGFKFSDLDMYHVDEKGNTRQISNDLALTKRYLNNNQPVGYDITCAGISVNAVPYKDVIYLTNYFKPVNFMVKTSQAGHLFLSGKNISLNSLPTVTIGEESTAKRVRSNSADLESSVRTITDYEFDIIDIYNFIQEIGGSVIKLPYEKYEAETVDGLAEAEKAAGFKSSGIGEVASAHLDFNPKSLKVNAGFKKVGTASISINGSVPQDLLTYTYATKSIFANGDNKMQTFGIAIPGEKEALLLKKLGKSLAFEKITDDRILEPMSKVIDTTNLTVYKVDTSKIELISKKKRSESILKESEILELLSKRFAANIISKAFGTRAGLLKELRTEYGDMTFNEADNKELFGLYNIFKGNEAAINAIKEAGINPYDGSFDMARIASKNGSTVTKKDDSEKKKALNIEYSIDGYDINKIKYSDVKEEALSGNKKLVPQKVLDAFINVYNISDLREKINAARSMYNSAEKLMKEIDKKLWLHTASMYLEGGKIKIHTHDSEKWEAGKSLAKGTVYRYTGADAVGLKVTIADVEI